MTRLPNTPGALSALLRRHGLAMHKGRGQNFLLDVKALTRIVRAAKLTGHEAVLEIGPGLGALTRQLAASAGRVMAVEVDAGFVRVLHETVGDLRNVHVAHADFLNLDLPTFAEQHLQPLPATVVANVPFYITSPILIALLRAPTLWKTIVVLVQKEVALRLQAGPGASDYGSLSVFVQFRAQVETVAAVPRGAFWPSPNVDSAVVRLTPHAAPPVAVQDDRAFERIVRAAFGQRRKTLANSLSPLLGKEGALAALTSAAIDPRRRGESLSMAEFAAIANVAPPPLTHHEGVDGNGTSRESTTEAQRPGEPPEE